MDGCFEGDDGKDGEEDDDGVDSWSAADVCMSEMRMLMCTGFMVFTIES